MLGVYFILQDRFFQLLNLELGCILGTLELVSQIFHLFFLGLKLQRQSLQLLLVLLQ